MKHLVTTVFILLLLGCTEEEVILFQPTLIENEEIFVPTTLEEAHSELDKALTEQAKEILLKDESDLSKRERDMRFMTLGHFGLGMWMRNNWKLWAGGPMAEYFSKLGVMHPDDMSGIIMNSYVAKLRGGNFDIEKETEFYKLYWKRAVRPEPYVDPGSGHKIDITDSEISYHLEDGRIVHVGEDTVTKEIWLYTFEEGWHLPSDEELRKIEEMTEGTSQRLN